MKAKGIFGSGILDLLAEPYRVNSVMNSGGFNKKVLKDHLRFWKSRDNNMPEFVLVWAEETSIGKNIIVTLKNIQKIQLIKGALYADRN